jgi:hypothetical protein
MRDKVSHPYQTAGHILLYIFIFLFLNSKRDNKRFFT